MSDQDSLVQHMDSQLTDVDRHAFMKEMEDTRRNFPRMDSGLSTTSRSTIHRVPPSPPSRTAELPGAPSSGLGTQKPKHAVAHPGPLPSIADSGYGTEQRRGSLGDVPAGSGQQVVANSMTPPSTAEAAESSQMNHEAVAWGDNNPFQRHPSTLSPGHNPEPGFLTDQDMGDYHDESFFNNMYYQDNTAHSRYSPGFPFDYPSQGE